MKKIYAFLALALCMLILCTSCATTSKASALQKSVGKDPFAGKVFASDAEVLQFQNDGTVLVYAIDVENGGLSKEIELSYTYNTNDKLFSSQTTAIYLPDGTSLTTKSALIEAELEPRLQNAEELFLQTLTPVDSSSQNIYKSLLKDSFASSAENFFTAVQTSSYTIQNEDNGAETLILKDVPLVDFGNESINFGLDKTSSYNVIFSEGLLVLTDVRKSSDTVDIAYVGIPAFNKKKQEITANLYRQTITYTEDSAIASFNLTETGDICISYNVSLSDVVTKDKSPYGLEYYTATYTLNFTKVPESIAELKELSYEQRRPLYEVSFSRGIIADFANKETE